ncbi:MAG: SAM-dependent methyltransferase [Ferruginibacter sp.]
MATTSSLLEYINTAAAQQQLIKITLGNKRNKEAELKNILIKPVIIKNKLQLSFVYRYPTKDLTKNFDQDEAISLIQKHLEDDFYNADVFTATADHFFSTDKNGKIKLATKTPSQQVKAGALQHDRQKERFIDPANNTYLHELGITTADGKVKKEMQDKYKQVNHYIDIIEGILKDSVVTDDFSIADMGSGKGYLTFALYDYLHNRLKKNISVTGIELRDDLVQQCNTIAAKAGFSKLSFRQGSIEAAELPVVDMLIALHACDTATDDAIYKGIQANAAVIVCAPCCHKQIRKQTAPSNALQSITRHGILLERQAEMITDSIRALILEAFGYKTKVFDFIATEHTPKNILIAGTKRKNESGNKEQKLSEIKALKEIFGIKQHYLEKLLGI